MESTRQNPATKNFIERIRSEFQSQERPDARRRLAERRERIRGRPVWWNDWNDYGFSDFGDFYYEDSFAIEDSFWNPVVLHYFSDEWDTSLEDVGIERGSKLADFYRVPFAYTGVFIPTQAIEDLLLNVSTLSIDSQLSFRTSLQRVLQLMEKELTQVLGANYQLQENHVTIDGYLVREGIGAVIEGTVGTDAAPYPYRAFLDFQTPSLSSAFVATSKVSAQSPERIAQIHALNQTLERAFPSEKHEALLELISADDPSWYGIQWTPEYCVPKDNSPNAVFILNPLNHRKVGSAAGIRLGDVICGIRETVEARFAELQKEALAKIYSYPHKKITNYIRRGFNKGSDYRTHVSPSIYVALLLAKDSCTEYKYSRSRPRTRGASLVCKKRLISEDERLQFRDYLIREFDFIKNLLTVQESARRSYGPNLEVASSEFVGAQRAEALASITEALRRELNAIPVSIASNNTRKEWTEQFFGTCSKDSFGSNQFLRGYGFPGGHGPLMSVFLQTVQYDLRSFNNSSQFLDGLREVGKGTVFSNCK